jgi:hypothetical protein
VRFLKRQIAAPQPFEEIPMRVSVRTTFAALSIACLAASAGTLSSQPALAQAAQQGALRSLVLRDGALCYLSKPLQEQSLIACIEQALKRPGQGLA